MFNNCYRIAYSRRVEVIFFTFGFYFIIDWPKITKACFEASEEAILYQFTWTFGGSGKYIFQFGMDHPVNV